MKKWVTFPWYIFLLPLFYVWHVNNEYFRLITPGISFQYLLYYLLLSLIIFLAGLLIFKNAVKSGILTVTFLIIFFFFGVTYDFLISLRLPSFLVSYKFLLSLILVLLIIISIRLKRKNIPLKLNRFFLVLFSFLVILEAGITVFYILTGKEKENNPAGYNQPLNIHLAAVGKKNAPDIFFIVFDEYTSSKALKKYFHFDNSALDSSLLRNGFFISTNSQSNYNSTPFSIASAFNMQYFNRGLETVPNDAYRLLQGAYSLKKSLLPKLLEEQGYKIINYGVCDIENHPASVTRVFEEYEIKTLSLETLWGRIQRDILWNLTERLPAVSNPVFNGKDFIDRNKNNYTRFLHELEKESDTPRFVVGHLLLPRRPAYVDRLGRPRSVSMDDFTDKNHDSLYLEQVIYANTLIDSLAKTAGKNRTRPLVLIMEGDHGNRYAEWGVDIREKQFMNMNTYYFSDKDYSLLYDSISPVNSFRVVLDKYFNAGLPLLKDSTIRLYQ